MDYRFPRYVVRQFNVTVNGNFCSWHDVLRGIPQGSILGPVLFIIYINDLTDLYKDLHTKFYIYADDTKLYRHIFNTEDHNELQIDIHRLKNCADEWLLVFTGHIYCILLDLVVLCAMAISTEADNNSYHVLPRYCTIHFHIYW